MGLLASKPEQAGGGQCSSTLAHVQQKLQRAEDELNAERGRGLDLLSDKADLQSQIELMPVVAGVGVFAGVALGAAAMAVRGKSAAARFQHVVATQTTKIEQLHFQKAKAEKAAVLRGARSMASSMLEVADDLDRAYATMVQHQGTAAAKDTAGAKAAAANSTMLSGIGMTRATLAKALAKENVQRMDTDEILGHPLDPELHEAVATVPLSATDGAAPNVVVDVVRSGYLIDGKLLRAPRVVVSQEA